MNTFRKFFIPALGFMLLISMAPAAFGDSTTMKQYCSAPPYVTRTIAPNLMILMDNSSDMMTMAYTDPFDSAEDYIGYFEPAACYSYSGGKFAMGSEDASGSCAAASPYRGRLMNWATMSKYDILQKVLVGGNATSKQGNAHTLVALGDAWTKTYDNCEFEVSSGNLVIRDVTAGSCTLLDDTAVPIALQLPEKGHGSEPEPQWASLASDWFTEKAAGLEEAINAWQLVPEAHAAAACGPITTGSLDTTIGDAYTLRLFASGCNNCTYTWSSLSVPSWLSGPYYADTDTKRTNGQVYWTGTPTTSGTESFSASVSSDKCSPAATISGSINIAVGPPGIDTTNLPDGQVGSAYAARISTQGGTTPFTWSLSDHPAGLSISNVYGSDGDYLYGLIEGTPTTAGDYMVNITVTDSAGQSATRTLNLQVIASSLNILTGSIPSVVSGETYSYQLSAGGGTSPYTWSLVSGSISGGGLSPGGLISGTAGAAGTSSFRVKVTDSDGSFVEKDFTMTVVESSGILTLETIFLDDAVRGTAYTYPLTASGGTTPYSWSISGQPSGMSIDASTGELSWTPGSSQVGTHTFTVTVSDSTGATVTQDLTVTVQRSSSIRSSSYTVNVTLEEEPLTDENGNNIWDQGESYTDDNGNGKWDGKQGIFQKFWDSDHPRARWGLTKFKDQSTSTDIVGAACIAADNASNYYTDVQNATEAQNGSPLASGLYGAINYYGFNGTNFSAYDSDAYSGCTNSDPIQGIPCRKNFVLILTSGSDVTGTAFANTTDCSHSDPLVQNACYGYKNDMRSDWENKQNVYTYIVNTMGSANNAVLAEAAEKGGGVYYAATSYDQLASQLEKAFEDILDQAASGTAVSVLTTSSRGIGSMVQAYFLPARPDGVREVDWTGYTQNVWIDTKDNLREDTVSDFKLNTGQDKVLRLFFDSETNETKAALFTTDSDGNINNCTTPQIKSFGPDINYNWEAGEVLARQAPSKRKLFTSEKVIRVTDASGTTSQTDISNNLFTETNVSSNATLYNALDPEVDYTKEEIVRYVRGECLETGVTGDTDCGSTTTSDFRDRRITVDGNLEVWKLGDIISSTPKVLSNTPQNTYHLDYGDTTYHSFISNGTYQDRVSVALVGANDGVLHAFRVGHLVDEGLGSGIDGAFRNAHDVAATDKLGQEEWGFIPFNAFPYLKYLAYPDYCHIYFNDLSIRLVDASLGTDTTTDPDHDEPGETKVTGSWKTILIGGMRFGGGCDGGTPAPPLTDTGYSAYYAIDVTDPLDPKPLWEFSDVDMGYATTFPSVIRTGNSANNGRWYVAVGSGSEQLPKSSTTSQDIGRDSTGYVYLLDLETGSLVKKIALDHNGIVGDILAIDSDKDYVSEEILFGTSYYDSTDSKWKGKLVSVDIPDQDLSTTWTPTVNYIMTADYPITASPDAAKDASGNTWVYGGTGKYFSDIDEEDFEQHIMFGLKLDVSGTTYPVADTDLTDQSSLTTTGSVTGTTKTCMHNPASNKFENRDMVTSINPSSTSVAVPNVGWKQHLSAGERVITRPLAVGGLVDFLTYKPSSDECAYGGDSYLYALDYVKGVAPSNVAIRSPDITVDHNTPTNTSTSGTVDVLIGTKLGPGAPPTGEAIIVPPPKEGQEQLKKKIQIATGVIIEAENTPAISVVSKILHWIKK